METDQFLVSLSVSFSTEFVISNGNVTDYCIEINVNVVITCVLKLPQHFTWDRG
jgi:hypothetical protein